MIESKFLNEMTPEGTINEASTTDSVLNEMYGAAREQLAQTVAKQEQVLEQVQQVHSRFARLNSGNNEVRDEFLKKLAQAYDAFDTLVNHLKEGQKVVEVHKLWVRDGFYIKIYMRFFQFVSRK